MFYNELTKLSFKHDQLSLIVQPSLTSDMILFVYLLFKINVKILENPYNKTVIDFNFGRYKDLSTLKSDIHLGLRSR